VREKGKIKAEATFGLRQAGRGGKRGRFSGGRPNGFAGRTGRLTVWRRLYGVEPIREVKGSDKVVGAEFGCDA
jgi:hypothetical protein